MENKDEKMFLDKIYLDSTYIYQISAKSSEFENIPYGEGP